MKVTSQFAGSSRGHARLRRISTRASPFTHDVTHAIFHHPSSNFRDRASHFVPVAPRRTETSKYGIGRCTREMCDKMHYTQLVPALLVYGSPITRCRREFPPFTFTRLRSARQRGGQSDSHDGFRCIGSELESWRQPTRRAGIYAALA